MARLVATLALAVGLCPSLADECDGVDVVDTTLIQYGAGKWPSWPWHRSHSAHRRSKRTRSGSSEDSHIPSHLVPGHEDDLPIISSEEDDRAIISPQEEYLPVVSDEEYLPAISNEDVFPVSEVKGRMRASTSTEVFDGARTFGDPHLENILHDRFQILHPGDHTLLNIPRGTPTEEALLYARAHVSALAGACSPMYIQRLDVGGRWLGDLPALRFSTSTSQFNTVDSIGLQVGKSGNVSLEEFISKVPASMVDFQRPRTGLRAPTEANQHTTTLLAKLRVGDISMKVSWVAELVSNNIANSLWLSIGNLTSVKMQIGGLLGVDDHSEAAQMPNECKAKQTSAASLLLEERSVLITSWASLQSDAAEDDQQGSRLR